jgi:hypothetical protein
MNSSYKLKKADFLGILSSSICLVHCITTPLLIAFGTSFISSDLFKYMFLILSFWAVLSTTKNQKPTKIVILLWISFFGFSFSNLFQERYDYLHYTGYFFTILLIFGHLLNSKQYYRSNCNLNQYQE